MKPKDFEKIIKAQDEYISDLGVDVWVGMEPTFTRRFSETPEWLSEALGPEKLQYAHALLKEISLQQPGGIVLHTLGRQYADEDLPRWSMGYYHFRDNTGSEKAVWDGPPDPYLVQGSGKSRPARPADVETFWQALNDELGQHWQTAAFTVDKGLRYRLLVRCDGSEPVVDFHKKPLLTRTSVHESKIPLDGLTDELAKEGDLLLSMDRGTAGGSDDTDDIANPIASVVIEMPEVPDVPSFMKLMQCIARAAKHVAKQAAEHAAKGSAEQSEIETLLLQGFPPPVDASVAWTTITPDPAVIEINQAPSDNASNFFARCELDYNAANAVGLDPCRLHYNGVVSDSGGGGQFTLGGITPLKSPFFHYPHLLSRLVRYLNAHPALSYWFAPPSIGSTSQTPRADENVQQSFQELSVALEQLDAYDQPEPEFIWRSLSPFLVDPSGNPHRSELNIEKLWNPYLPGRGFLGLVEFRAFRMARSSQTATAIAVLLRSIIAMLSQQDKVSQLLEHGASLHDKYALPLFLQADLESVFDDLHDAGLPVHDYLRSILLQEPVRFTEKAVFHGCCIELQQALEFWPLIGEAPQQGEGGSRLVDASTTRLQITLAMESQDSAQIDDSELWHDWELWFEGYRVPLRPENGRQDALQVTGLRYRNFMPFIGLHPGIKPHSSITLILANRHLDETLQITYHEWHPENEAYPGLPEDMDDAETRRSQRFTTSVIAIRGIDKPKDPPASAVTDYCLDLRRLP
jgi:uncharacterized protein (DUF2126 family)